MSVPVVSTIKIFTESRTIPSVKRQWKRKRKTETNEKPNPKPIIPEHLPFLKINIEYTSNMSQFTYWSCAVHTKHWPKLYGLGLEHFRLAIKMSPSGQNRIPAEIIHNFPLLWHHCLTWDIAFLQMEYSEAAATKCMSSAIWIPFAYLTRLEGY